MTTATGSGKAPSLFRLPWLREGPEDVVPRFLDLPMPLLLESARVNAEHGRWSFLMADPFAVVTARGLAVEIERGRIVERRSANPFEVLRDLLAGLAFDRVPHGPPFQGGIAGYFGYELNGVLERVPASPIDDLAVPDLCVGFYDWVVAWDHLEGEAWLVSSGLPADAGEARTRNAEARAALVLDRLRGRAPAASVSPHLGAVPGWNGGRRRWTTTAKKGEYPTTTAGDGENPAAAAGLGECQSIATGGGEISATAAGGSENPAATAGGGAYRSVSTPAPRRDVTDLPGVSSTFSREEYLAAVERVRAYILAGDIYQANLSQRLDAPLGAPPFALYRALRDRNPAPFAAYFDTGAAVLVSASPERFLRLEGGVVETRPIKGTAPRGATPAEDRARAHRLRVSRKDRAENIMIVDLMRNDLSVVCEDDSVAVRELCALEAHPTVHHLVSTVTGRLRGGLGPIDLLRAAFPGGSITGTPKIRSMQIIAELEPVRRGVYTGAIGYIGGDGTMDTSIAIRTFIIQEGRVYFPVGGGVVVDSDPALEYAESLAKARGLAEALARLGDAALRAAATAPGGRGRERGSA